MITTGEDPEKLLTRRMLDTFGVASSDDLSRERVRYGPVSKAYLGLAARIVDQSGVMARISEWDAAARKSNAGAKAAMPYRAVLILLLLHIQMGLGANYQRIADTLAYRFDPEHRAALGIAEKASSRRGWYLRMWRSTNNLLNLMDPYPAPRNKRLDQAEFESLRDEWQSADGQRHTEDRLQRIDWVCEQLLHTSVRMLPADIWERFGNNIAVDATKLQIAGRPNSANPRRRRSNADPYSERYRREGNHDGQGARTDVAAYELENAVMVWNKPGDSAMFPSLALSITFHQPGRLSGHGLRLVESAERLGVEPGLVIGDRAYNNEVADTFQIPIRKKGWELVIDYKKTDLGIQSAYKDLILVEGTWYVSYMPDALANGMKAIQKEIEDPSTGDTEIQVDEAALKKLLESREPYRMIPKGRPDSDGYQRFSYPRPGTYIAVDRGSGKKIRPTTPRTVTIPIDAGGASSDRRKSPPPAMKYVQKFPYLSSDHRAHYGMRNLVESHHKTLKDPGREDMDNKAKRSGRGYAFHYLAAALASVSVNLRKIESFFSEEHERASKLHRRARRRKTQTGARLPQSVLATAPPT